MFAWLLHNMVLAAILAAVALAVGRSKRCSPALRHALWLLVLVRLVLPPGVLHWPWIIPLPQTEAAVAGQTTSGDSAPGLNASVGVLERVEIVSLEATSSETSAASVPTIESVASAPPAVSLWLTAAWIAGSIWAVGAAVVILRYGRGIVDLRRLLHHAEAANAGFARRVDEIATQLRIRAPRIAIIPNLTSPLVAGLWRPVLLWPKGLTERLSDDGLRTVLIHELAHLRRRDHWVRWLEMVAACIWWWNPLFLVARRRVRQYAELACDAWVLSILPRARRAYAEALLMVCESSSRIAEPAPALGIGGDPKDFQRRLTMIMSEKVSCRVPRAALLAVGLLVVLTIPAWSLGETSHDERAAAQIANVEAEDELIAILDLDVEQLASTPDRDKKLAALEEQIQALLKEIRALKAEAAATKKPASRDLASKALIDAVRARDAQTKERIERLAELTKTREAGAKALADLALRGPAKIGEKDVVLHRVAYTLSANRAQALSTFLKENVRTPFLDCVVNGDKLIVTATPESQTIIEKLVLLIQGLPRNPKR